MGFYVLGQGCASRVARNSLDSWLFRTPSPSVCCSALIGEPCHTMWYASLRRPRRKHFAKAQCEVPHISPRSRICTGRVEGCHNTGMEDNRLVCQARTNIDHVNCANFTIPGVTGSCFICGPIPSILLSRRIDLSNGHQAHNMCVSMSKGAAAQYNSTAVSHRPSANRKRRRAVWVSYLFTGFQLLPCHGLWVRGSWVPCLAASATCSSNSFCNNKPWVFTPTQEWGSGDRCCQTMDKQTRHWLGSDLSMSGQDPADPSFPRELLKQRKGE